MTRRSSRLIDGLAFILAISTAASCDWREAKEGGSHLSSASDLSQTALSLEKQQEIWDVEHITFELENHFGKPFVKALVAKDEIYLRSHFRSGFQGKLFTDQGEILRRHGPMMERIRSVETSESRHRDASQLIHDLLEEVARLERVDRTGFRMLKLHRDQNQSDLWRGRVLMTFEGVQTDEQVVTIETEYEINFQFEQDEEIGKTPIVRSWVALKQSLRTGRQWLMEEATQSMGLDRWSLIDNWKVDKSSVRMYPFQMAVEDFDRDGFPDIAIAPTFGKPLLLRNQEGREFQNVAIEMGLPAWPSERDGQLKLAVWIDFDNDGFPDLLLGKRLYRNVDGKKFIDVTARSGLRVAFEPMGGVVADYDCDGLLDLYLVYQVPTEIPPGQPAVAPWVGDNNSGVENRLWRNEGDGRFRDVTDESQASGGRRHSFAATWHFYDEDRFPDLYIANDMGNNVHLRNRGDGTFEDISALSGLADFATSMGVASGDINNDGSPEIYVANMYSKMGRRIIDHVCEADYPAGIYSQILGSCAGNRLYQRTEGEAFKDIGEKYGVYAVGWAYAPAFIDLDSDGWLDLYACTGFLSFDRTKPDG